MYTTGVLAPDKPALCVCVKRTYMCARENARGRKRERKKRERERKKREKDDVCLRTTGLFLRTRSEHDQIEGDVSTGQRHQKYRYQTIEGGIWVFFKNLDQKRR